MGKKGDAVDGVLLLDKPEGMSSNWALQLSRRLINAQKAGHTGTLDPFATGLLPLAFGNATKYSADLLHADKRYEAVLRFGARTDTMDKTGEVTETSDMRPTRQALEALLPEFTGQIEQVPPMYSAVKVNGQKLYDLARKGKEVERPARDITILDIALLDFDEQAQKGAFRVTCSKGTYVRTIVHDLGQKLGTCAAMHALTRIRSGVYTLAQAVTFETVERARDDGTLGRLFQPTDSLFADDPAVRLTAEGRDRALRGAVVFPRQAEGLAALAPGTLCRVYAPDGQFLMLGRADTLDKGGIGLFVHKNFR